MQLFNYFTKYFSFHSYRCKYIGDVYGTPLHRSENNRRHTMLPCELWSPYALSTIPFNDFDLKRFVAYLSIRPCALNALSGASKDFLTRSVGDGLGVCVDSTETFYIRSNVRLIISTELSARVKSAVCGHITFYLQLPFALTCHFSWPRDTAVFVSEIQLKHQIRKRLCQIKTRSQ